MLQLYQLSVRRMIEATCCPKSTKACSDVIRTVWLSSSLGIGSRFHCFTWSQIHLPHCIWNNIVKLTTLYDTYISRIEGKGMISKCNPKPALKEPCQSLCVWKKAVTEIIKRRIEQDYISSKFFHYWQLQFPYIASNWTIMTSQTRNQKHLAWEFKKKKNQWKITAFDSQLRNLEENYNNLK